MTEKGAEIGPFAAAARDLYARGLAPVPCPGDNGKSVKGAVRGHGKWRSRPPRVWLETMIGKWPNANIGILTGLSRMAVVDVDGPDELVRSMIERFGDTPLKTRTPSGGVHLWYRGAGEGCANLRKEGLAVDVKGKGGLIVVPPSIRPSGEFAGRRYEFMSGGWDDVARLPKMRSGALRRELPKNVAPLRAIERGHRNHTLFRTLLQHAPYCDDWEALLDCARAIASQHFASDPSDPFTDAEVAKVAESAWRYESEGRNWAGKDARVYTTVSEYESVVIEKHGSDALALLIKLRLSHWDRSEFSLSLKAMAAAGVIPGWSLSRYRKARDVLIRRALIIMLNPGGHGAGDACRCKFAEPTAAKGLKSDPNITEHLFSLAPALPGGKEHNQAHARTVNV